MTLTDHNANLFEAEVMNIALAPGSDQRQIELAVAAGLELDLDLPRHGADIRHVRVQGKLHTDACKLTDKALNDLGGQGWELVAVFPLSQTIGEP